VAPAAVSAGARDADEWVALVWGLVANASVTVVAKRHHMSVVFRVMRCAAPSVATP
jgi:hypothetical protein